MPIALCDFNKLNILRHDLKDLKEKYEELQCRALISTSGPCSIRLQGNKTESRISRYYPPIEKYGALIDLKTSKILNEAITLEQRIIAIPDSFTRRIFTLRFIEGMEWQDVAQQIGGGHSAKSVSCICYRYIEKLARSRDGE